MQHRIVRRAVTCLAIAATPVSAQTPVPTRTLTIVAESPPVFTNVNMNQLHHYADGRVLVHDVGRQRVVVLDPTLKQETVALDTVRGRDNSYSLGILLDPQGKPGRVIPAPRGLGNLAQAGWSSAFGLVSSMLRTPDAPVSPDSTLIGAYNADTREVTRLGAFFNGMRATVSTAPMPPDIFPVSDQMTVMADGSIAIVRVLEYRVEWISPDRTHTVSPRVAYAWKQLSDAERAHVLDSANTARKRVAEERLATWVKDSIAIATGKLPPRTTAAGARAGQPLQGAAAFGPRPPVYFPATINQVPSYLPPFAPGNGNVMADADNHLWVRSIDWAAPAGSPITYDVIDRAGALIYRVALPDGRRIVGFGPKGLVYLLGRDAGVIRIERATVK
jgi:hypothetical protein